MAEMAAPTGSKSAISRHRRVHKEVGAVTGISFIDHPKAGSHYKGVVVSALNPDGACAKSGVRVGDHISKINGERPTDRAHAVTLCDEAWTAEADGSDKNKDRLKFSLHYRTQDFEIAGRQTGTRGGGGLADEDAHTPDDDHTAEAFDGLSLNATVGVEVVGSKKGMASALLGGGKKLEDSGLTLEDSPAGFGGLVVTVAEHSPAHVAGLEPGLTIVSVGGTLCHGNHKECEKMIAAARASKAGCASLVCHLKKSKDEDEHI